MEMYHSQILPNLFVGAYPRSSDDIDDLKEIGINAVLNLQTDDDFRYLDIDWDALRARYFAQHIKVRRIPIRDFDDDELREHLPVAVRELNKLAQDGRTVYVHCSAGANRSPTVVIAYLHWVLGKTLKEADRHVRKCHRCLPVTGLIRQAKWEG
jgi:protein-tyrosine phosphatase